MILIKERRLVDEIYRNIKKNTYIGNYQYFGINLTLSSALTNLSRTVYSYLFIINFLV